MLEGLPQLLLMVKKTKVWKTVYGPKKWSSRMTAFHAFEASCSHIRLLMLASSPHLVPPILSRHRDQAMCRNVGNAMSASITQEFRIPRELISWVATRDQRSMFPGSVRSIFNQSSCVVCRVLSLQECCPLDPDLTPEKVLQCHEVSGRAEKGYPFFEVFHACQTQHRDLCSNSSCTKKK